MESQTVTIKPNLKVVLRTNSEMLDEVMVVAFGTAKKSAFTGSATVVDSEKLEQSQVTSVTNALAGAVPGVTLTSRVLHLLLKFVASALLMQVTIP